MEKSSLTYLFLFLLVFISCKKSEDPDPCLNLSPVSAKFIIREELGDTLSHDTDTINAINLVVFESVGNMDIYKWKIGSDDREWNTKEVKLSFASAKGQTIPVTLIVNKEPNKNCFPYDNGVDTITKTFYVAKLYELPILGNYYGNNEGDINNKFVVKIDTFQDPNSPLPYPNNLSILLGNLPEGCNEDGTKLMSYGQAIGGKHFRISGKSGGIGSCYGLNAFGTLEKDGSITINYSYTDPIDNKKKYYTFKGIKQ